jgi:hypothetical protein
LKFLNKHKIIVPVIVVIFLFSGISLSIEMINSFQQEYELKECKDGCARIKIFGREICLCLPGQ